MLLLSIVVVLAMIGGNDKPDITTDIPDDGVDDGGVDDGTGDDDQSTDDGDDQPSDSGDDDKTGEEDPEGEDPTNGDDPADEEVPDEEDPEEEDPEEEDPDEEVPDEEDPADDDEEESAPYRHRHREGERNGAPEVQNLNCMEDEEQKEAVKIMQPEAKFAENSDKGEQCGHDDVSDPEPAEEEPAMDADVGEEQNQEQKSDGQANGNSQKNNP